MENKLKYFFFIVFIVLFSLTFISAVPPVTTTQNFPEGYLITEEQEEIIKLGEDYTYNFFVQNSSSGYFLTNTSVNCTFFMANSSGSVLLSQNVFYNGNYWEVSILGENFTYSGEYPYGLYCLNGDVGGALSGTFLVTYSGKNIYDYQVYYHIFIIFFFFILTLAFYFYRKSIDLEKLNNSIINKYENKNYIKLVLFSLSYNVLKNSFIIYYLSGLLILNILYSSLIIYNLEELISIFEPIIVVYTLGIILVGLIFLSYVQEWFMDLLEKIKDSSWGITNG